MIALLLTAQILGAVPASPNPQTFAVSPPARAGELIRVLPGRAVCKGDPAQLDAAFATPAAIYRKGDRPERPLKNWADYPDGVVCAVGAAK